MPKLKSLRDASPEDIKTRLNELREEFIALNDDEGKRADLDSAALRSMVDEVDTLDTFLTLMASEEQRAKAQIAATAGAKIGKGIRSLGDAAITEETLHDLARELTSGWSEHVYDDGRRTQRQHVRSMSFDGELGQQITRDLQVRAAIGHDGIRAITEWGSGGPPNFDGTDSGGLLPRLGQPIPPVPRQAKLYLRDLIPGMTTTLPTMPYVRELNPVTYESAASGGATTVAEGSTKPTANLSFVSENAPIATIAATLTLSKQMFQDAAAVVQYVNQRLPYLVKLAEDNQFLNGNGTWPNVQGILNTSGLLTSSGGTSGDYAPQIGTAMAKIENQDGATTAVVMNPTDAWTMFTKRAAGGSGTFDAGTPFATLPLTVWGVPTYRSRVYPQGTALVSDFERGAMVVDREQVNTQIYNERYAEQNLVLLICEERTGLMVFRPDLFCQTTLS